MNKIRVIAVRPDRPEGYITNVSNDPLNLKRYVGGDIETLIFHIAEGTFAVISDDKGRLKGKPVSAMIDCFDFVGDVLLTGIDGGEFTDIPKGIEKLWKEGGLLCQ